MRILMTGATSFSGKCLLRHLKSSDYEIWHLVRSHKGFSRELIWDFSGPLPEGLPPCDVLVHLAAYVNFGQGFEPAQYHVNTLSTMKLAAYARENKSHFIFASTVGIHGSLCELIDKNTPVNPDNNYSLSKYLAEEIIKTFTDDYSILRINGIYGLDGPGHLGLNKAISDAVYNQKTPTLKGSGRAKRNYICVQDVAQWILRLIKDYDMSYRDTNANKKEILYLAGLEVMSIEDYLQQIVDVILPDTAVEKIEGPAGRDVIVHPSPAPFELMTFKQYLNKLIR